MEFTMENTTETLRKGLGKVLVGRENRPGELPGTSSIATIPIVGNLALIRCSRTVIAVVAGI